MNRTSSRRPCIKHTFGGHTGYVVAPWLPGAAHDWAAVRHSASVPPWTDADIHLHTQSEELFFVFQGELRLLIDGSVFTLRPYEALLTRPGVPHTTVGGRGPIEHFVLRIPATNDRQSLGPIPSRAPVPTAEQQRTLERRWGCRVRLDEQRHQACWLFGAGRARLPSVHFCLAYMSFANERSARADRHPHQLHLHRESWEVYAVLRGSRTLQLDEDLVEIREGELLEVAPGTPHGLRATRTPFEGFTFRVPNVDDKVVLSGAGGDTGSWSKGSTEIHRGDAEMHEERHAID